MAELQWQREAPHVSGYWLWVEVGGGAILQSGTFCVPEIPVGSTCSFLWLIPSGATAWAKIELPSDEARSHIRRRDDSVAPGDSVGALEADYRILVGARGWLLKRREAFCGALREIWGERERASANWPSHFGILYEPGDYARAAAKVEGGGR